MGGGGIEVSLHGRLESTIVLSLQEGIPILVLVAITLDRGLCRLQRIFWFHVPGSLGPKLDEVFWSFETVDANVASQKLKGAYTDSI